MALAPVALPVPRPRRPAAFVVALAMLASMIIAQAAARAEPTYPNRTVRIVVPFAPGGAVDSIARLIGSSLQQRTGQSFIVENKPGASGMLGAETVAKAMPDGYTVLIAANGLATNAALFPQSRVDTLKDFAPVSGIGFSPLVLVTSAGFAAGSVSDLIALAKAKPDDLTYGSTGIGSSNHLAAEMLKSETGTALRHVPYRGGAPALIDLMAGRISMMLINPAEVSQHIESGQLKALAVTSATRLASFPKVPTMTEAGIKGFEASVWWCMVAPAGTPPDVVAILNAGVRAALSEAALSDKLTTLGVITRPTTPVELGEFLAAEVRTWGDVIPRGNIEAE